MDDQISHPEYAEYPDYLKSVTNDGYGQKTAEETRAGEPEYESTSKLTDFVATLLNMKQKDKFHFLRLSDER